MMARISSWLSLLISSTALAQSLPATQPASQPAAAGDACIEAVEDLARLPACEATLVGGVRFARAYGERHGPDTCVDALAHAADGGRRAGDFVAGIRQYFKDDKCDFRKDFLGKLCGLAITCWDGGNYGLAAHPIASLGAFAVRLAGEKDGAVVKGLDDLTVAVGVGLRFWLVQSWADVHAAVFYSQTKSAETAGETTATRFGTGIGVGAINGALTLDVNFLGLAVDGEFDDWGLALMGRIDLASASILGLAAK